MPTQTVTIPVLDVGQKKSKPYRKYGEIRQFKAIVVIGDTVQIFGELCQLKRVPMGHVLEEIGFTDN